MDDPGWAWPAWKFGMKGDDLFTKLNDQYNTFASTIQDPEAFHHDVFEISNDADTVDEFHRLMADRKQQRLRELNESLESAAFEIIANPKLIGTDQWQYALQLFRTKSLDSLVRYFASYLPQDYFDRYAYRAASSTASSFTDRSSIHSASTHPSSVDDAHGPSFFPDHEDKPIMTHEPLSINTTSLCINTTTSTTSAAVSSHLPLSPRSMTMKSDTSVSSPNDDVADYEDHDTAYRLRNYTPARTLSFSGSESDAFSHARSASIPRDDEDETSQSDDPESLAASVSDLDEARCCSSVDSLPPTKFSTCCTIAQPAIPGQGLGAEEEGEGQEEDFPSAQLPASDIFDDYMESETPTPKPYLSSSNSSYISSKSLAAHRIPSPPHRVPSPKMHRARWREASPSTGCVKRSPEESLSRIQKPLTDAFRMRPRGRRRGLD